MPGLRLWSTCEHDCRIMTIPPRFEISAAQIDQIVAVFYNRVRAHPMLGPIFAAHVTDWPKHEAKIAAFWRNAIIYERGYDGNPMAVHQAAGNVRPGHFTPWLALFDAVLAEQLPPDTAAGFSALAHRIGRGLRMAVADPHRVPGAPPNLRGSLF